MSPTQRSLKLLRSEGYTAAVVEQWNAFAGVRQDLFGCIDIVAIRSDLTGVLGVQCTTVANQAARFSKALNSDVIETWLRAENRFEVWGWARKGGRGTRKLWQVKRHIITMRDVIARRIADKQQVAERHAENPSGAQLR